MVQTAIATLNDVDDILECINDAFMEYAFFKKPEYHQKFTRENVTSMLLQKDSVFILAYNNEICEHFKNKVVGTIFLHWITTTETYVLENDSIAKVTLIGKFSSLSVPPKYANQGFGKALVSSAEKYLCQEVFNTIQHTTLSASDSNKKKQFGVLMELKAINFRKDLLSWYEKQGYQFISEIRQLDAAFTRRLLEDKDVYFILMRKILM
ncbi:uncharacterized protein LOC100196985 [Hydra vulgaris]|uniref:uncharacterized protein LOC100196985 n=1 Tax=Hydra vulgaris TaxID=6087 RepID=UPI00019253FE|nr:uncharacterized protein LOC100196985 [Hydra vulgaris]XP_012561732.1 uncharacterized protein LOC100196985 [Hydra vulgaris]XP_047138744.1 uncharacterized protein LOC100196985 [Hydra vulgaris]